MTVPMTILCPECGCVDVKVIGDNGAEYPETRVEFYECQRCDHEFSKVLAQ